MRDEIREIDKTKKLNVVVLNEAEENNLLHLLNTKSSWLYSTLFGKNIKVIINGAVVLDGIIDVDSPEKNEKKEELKMEKFEKNTLDVVSVSIMETDEFLKSFQDAPVMIWLSSSTALYMIDKLTSYKFVEDNHADIFVLFGSNDDVKVSIPTRAGFGIKIKKNTNHYWVDKFNEKEALVIQYNSEQKGVKA